MDGVYALQRHIYDLTRKYYLIGRDRTIAELNVRPGQHLLEIGCGTARNLVLIARRYPHAGLHGIDISSEMLKTAQAKLERAGLMQQVHIARGDAADFDACELFGRPQFDRVMFSYTLSMVSVWREALDMAASLLARNGELHIVDFGTQDRLPRWFANLLGGWLAKFHVTRRENLRKACDQLAAEHGLSLEYHSLYGDYARRIVLRRQ